MLAGGRVAVPQFTRKIWLKIRACRGYRPERQGSATHAPNGAERGRGLGPSGEKKMMERTLALVDSARLKPRNRLLAALPPETLSNLRGHLKPVSLPRDTVLCEADEPLRRIYFVEVGRRLAGNRLRGWHHRRNGDGGSRGHGRNRRFPGR